MAAKDDASTDIERLTKAFADDMTKACAEIRKARMAQMEEDGDGINDKKKAEDPPLITFKMSTKNPVNNARTPAEQAELLVGNKPSTYVCWSAHMADKARHVLMYADGRSVNEPKKVFEKEDFATFLKMWGQAMKSRGLKNFKGNDGWGEGDAFHLELPDSKITQVDARAKACMDEYARLTRKEGKGKNQTFENKYQRDLAPYLKKYE
jgi:hypothetical protein